MKPLIHYLNNMYNYINTPSIFKDSGWKCIRDIWYANSQDYMWAPLDKRVEDIYIWDSYSNSRGYSLQFVWAETVPKAEVLLSSSPSMYYSTEEELKVLIKCIKG